MEDLVCRYDGTVRNSTGDVLQFLYGEDGMNAQMLEEQSIDLLNMTDAETARRVRARPLACDRMPPAHVSVPLCCNRRRPRGGGRHPGRGSQFKIDLTSALSIFNASRGVVTVGVAQEVNENLSKVQAALDREFRRIEDDRRALRDRIYLRLKDGNKCFMPVNIRRVRGPRPLCARPLRLPGRACATDVDGRYSRGCAPRPRGGSAPPPHS